MTLDSFKRVVVLAGVLTLLTNAWSAQKGRSSIILCKLSGRDGFIVTQDASSDKHDGNYICKFAE